MAVTLQIGQERYIAENAAEESTLEEILYAMQSQLAATTNQTSTISKNQKSQTINTQQSNSALGGFNQAARRTEDTLEDLENAADVTSGSLLDTARNVASGFNSAIKGMVSSLEKGEIDPRAMIENISGAVATGLSGLGTAAGAAIGSVVPVVGTAAGAAVGKFIGDGLGATLTTLSGAVGTAIGIMDGFAKTTQTLANEGVVFGEGISTATQNILDTGMTMGQFSKLVQESGDSLRLLGGSTTQGSKRFIELYKNLKDSRTEFINLGYSIEDLPSLMADYTSGLGRFGNALENMTPNELKQGTLDYAKNLRTLSDLTGKDVKTLKEKQRQVTEESQLQNKIRQMQEAGIGDADKRIGAAVDIIEEMGFSYEDAVKFINRQVMTGEAAVMGSANGINQALSSILQNLANTDPSVPLDQFTNGLVKGVKEFTPQIEESSKNLGQIAATGGDAAVAVTKGLGKLNSFLQGIENYDPLKAQRERDAAAANAAKDPLNEGIVALEDGKQKIAESMQTLATTLTKESAPLITDAIKKLTEAIEMGAKGIASLFAEETPIAKKQLDIINNDTFKKMQEGESTSMNPFADREIKSQIAALINALTDAGKTQEEISNELAKMGIERGYGDLSYTKIRPLEPVQNPTPVPVPSVLDNLAPTPEGAMAFGDIVKPKPGGTILRVAEAGEAEAIMPTAKTEKGELGIKVTGELIDSSYLMKTLVDTNKGGNGLLATLVSKLDNLNSNFEKLVYEQRQANRLAV